MAILIDNGVSVTGGPAAPRHEPGGLLIEGDRIARGFPPTRPLAGRIACPISMDHYQRSSVLRP